VAVRTLCEFTAKQGDLDLRFTPSPSALEGMAGHVLVTSRRGAAYETEVPLQASCGSVLARGRADGFDPQSRRLDEIKTFRGDLQRQPRNHRVLHWAQAKVYAHMLCASRGLSEIEVALVYFDIGSQKETTFTELHQAQDLREFFETLCQRYAHWAALQAQHRARRDASLQALTFPFGEFRAGQRVLAESVYKAQTAARCFMAQAPTGIGKTMACMFPVLKAMPVHGLDKLYFLTAKTPGRQLALDAVQRLQEHRPDMPLRTLELVARDKACEHPDLACHGESCPLAKGFYDRLPRAREAALDLPLWDRATLRELALQHHVCPYYLGQELARWSDVVVGDYNHFFDVTAGLHAMKVVDDLRVSVLVDEAHNLLERARAMYSADLEHDGLYRVRHSAPKSLKKALDRVHRAWNAMLAGQSATYEVHDSVPEKFVLTLQKLNTEFTDFFAEHPAESDGELQAFYFKVLHFLRMVELHGPHALFDITLADSEGAATRRGSSGSVLCLRNVVPGPLLKERWAAAHSATLFSATLSPPQFVQDMLGLPESTAWLDVPSAFAAEQLQVRVARHISTRWRDRAGSLDALVAVMAGQYQEAPGNYLAFFSSFDYLQQVAERFAALHGDLPVWLQSRRMGEAERDAFLARFQPDGQGIGFAVLGGAFGEGIDLPGSRLIGAFIATLGLPQVNPVNEQLRQRMQAMLGQGYAYTYLYPGLQKVVQAAGRVIRTPQDRGVVWLLDDRFAQAEVRALYPAWWELSRA